MYFPDRASYATNRVDRIFRVGIDRIIRAGCVKIGRMSGESEEKRGGPDRVEKRATAIFDETGDPMWKYNRLNPPGGK